MSFSYDLAELGRYYRAYDVLMAHWRHVLPAGVMLEVQYEDLESLILNRRPRAFLATAGWNGRSRAGAFT
jgi:hypothetical protein